MFLTLIFIELSLMLFLHEHVHDYFNVDISMTNLKQILIFALWILLNLYLLFGVFNYD